MEGLLLRSGDRDRTSHTGSQATWRLRRAWVQNIETQSPSAGQFSFPPLVFPHHLPFIVHHSTVCCGPIKQRRAKRFSWLSAWLRACHAHIANSSAPFVCFSSPFAVHRSPFYGLLWAHESTVSQALRWLSACFRPCHAHIANSAPPFVGACGCRVSRQGPGARRDLPVSQQHRNAVFILVRLSLLRAREHATPRLGSRLGSLQWW